MKISRWRVALGVLAAVAGFGLAATPAAHAAGSEGACYATGDAHCYTVMWGDHLSPVASRVNAQYNYTCLVKPAGFGGWSSVQTMWVQLVENPSPANVELGIWNQNSTSTTGPNTFYWARTGGTYGSGFQVVDTGVVAPAGNSIPVRVQRNASTMTVYTGNPLTLRATLSSPLQDILYGSAGGEATTNSGSHKFDTWGLQRVQNGVTYAGWPGAGASTAWTSPPWSDPPMIYNDGELFTRKTATGAAC